MIVRLEEHKQEGMMYRFGSSHDKISRGYSA